jgi:hypothetical protein
MDTPLSPLDYHTGMVRTTCGHMVMIRHIESVMLPMPSMAFDDEDVSTYFFITTVSGKAYTIKCENHLAMLHVYEALCQLLSRLA